MKMTHRRSGAGLGLLVLIVAASPRARAEPPQRISALVATSFLGNGAAGGVALASGARFALGEHAALGADVGYGVLSARATTQDRWWLVPSIAWVIPIDPVRIDVGAGFGLGASSGYASFASYARGPFSPAWSFQLVPTARAHVMTGVALGRDVALVVRVEAFALPFLESGIGFRTSRAPAGPSDAVWMDTGLGLELRLW